MLCPVMSTTTVMHTIDDRRQRAVSVRRDARSRPSRAARRCDTGGRKSTTSRVNTSDDAGHDDEREPPAERVAEGGAERHAEDEGERCRRRW